MQYQCLCSPEDGHNDARNMLRHKLIRTETFTVLTPYKTALPTATNHIQENQNNTPKAVTGLFVLLTMGIMMPETC
jgi:hypothetical protein